MIAARLPAVLEHMPQSAPSFSGSVCRWLLGRCCAWAAGRWPATFRTSASWWRSWPRRIRATGTRSGGCCSRSGCACTCDFIGKREALFWGPLGLVPARVWSVLPVDRGGAHGVVDEMRRQFRAIRTNASGWRSRPKGHARKYRNGKVASGISRARPACRSCPYISTIRKKHHRLRPADHMAQRQPGSGHGAHPRVSTSPGGERTAARHELAAASAACVSAPECPASK